MAGDKGLVSSFSKWLKAPRLNSVGLKPYAIEPLPDTLHLSPSQQVPWLLQIKEKNNISQNKKRIKHIHTYARFADRLAANIEASIK